MVNARLPKGILAAAKAGGGTYRRVANKNIENNPMQSKICAL
jgi:hypothetical protein